MAWRNIINHLRYFSYRANSAIHWRWLAWEQSVGPAGWVIWTKNVGNYQWEGAITCYFWLDSMLLEAHLYFCTQKDTTSRARYPYRWILIEDIVVPETRQGVGLGSQLLALLETVATIFNAQLIRGQFGFRDEDHYFRLVTFYKKNGYHVIHGKHPLIEKWLPQRMLRANPSE